MKKFAALSCGLSVLAFLAPAQSSFASAFVPGNLVVVQDGTGAAALSSSATAAFINEYNPLGGAAIQSLALPTAISGLNQPLTLSGTATSEGFLTLSANGQYLTIGGYNAIPGAASPTGGVGNRVVGRVDMSGNIDSTTILGDATSLGNIRSTVSDNGVNFWVGTSAGGVRYTTLGSVAATTQLSTTPSNIRVANISAGQLYVTSASGTVQGIATVGSGLPTTSGQTTTLLNGFPTAAGPSPYDYFFADANTVYVADDRAVGSGGLQKWIFSGSAWSLAYTLTAGLTAGLRGLAGVDDGAGNAILYATTADATTAVAGNKLVTITDVISAGLLPGTTFTTLETAPGNTAFRGVDLIPSVPEPSTVALTSLGLLSLAFIRRSRKA